MGLSKNAKNQYYQIKIASDERKTPNGQTIAKGETYLRFYHVTQTGETVAIHIISANVDLSLTGCFKLPDNKFNATRKLVAERCDQCGTFYLTDANERFCCAAHGEVHLTNACLGE